LRWWWLSKWSLRTMWKSQATKPGYMESNRES
jgi:hypothetical protein